MLKWQVHSRAVNNSLPEAILTVSGPAQPTTLPLEIAAHLPAEAEGGDWLDQLTKTPELTNIAVGLLVANPMLLPQRVSAQLQTLGVKTVINLPSVAQHDPEFGAMLSEVDLGPQRELEMMISFREAGLSCIVAVATAQEAQSALAAGFDHLAVLPRVQAYESGFPSELSRNRAVASVAALPDAADATLLSLVTAAEARIPSVWPAQANAVIERPIRL
ncbi:MAG: phosphoenolpyruvate hydrolase family protein [Pseudomonadota bacterium]